MPVVKFENVKDYGEQFGAAAGETRLQRAREELTAARVEGGGARLVSAESELAEALFELRRYAEALPVWENAVQDAMDLWGEDDELTLEAAEYLALCLKRVGRGEEALDLCDQFGLDEDILY